MKIFDEVLSGTRAAYEGRVWTDGVAHGPFYGHVETECVQEKCYTILYLYAGKDEVMQLRPRNASEAGSFLIALGQSHTYCTDCFALDAPALPLEDEMRFAERPMITTFSELAGPRKQQQRVGIELRRLRPAKINIDAIEKAFRRSLGFEHAGPDERDALIIRLEGRRADFGRGTFLAFNRPVQVFPEFQHCEAEITSIAEVRIDRTCPANWRIEFPNHTYYRQCCKNRIYRGPSRSGHFPNSCVAVPAQQ